MIKLIPDNHLFFRICNLIFIIWVTHPQEKRWAQWPTRRQSSFSVRYFLSQNFPSSLSFFVSLYIVSFKYLLSPFVSYIIFSSYHFLTVWTSTLSATRHQSFQIIPQIWGLRIILCFTFFGGGGLIDRLTDCLNNWLLGEWMDGLVVWLTDILIPRLMNSIDWLILTEWLTRWLSN